MFSILHGILSGAEVIPRKSGNKVKLNSQGRLDGIEKRMVKFQPKIGGSNLVPYPSQRFNGLTYVCVAAGGIKSQIFNILRFSCVSRWPDPVSRLLQFVPQGKYGACRDCVANSGTAFGFLISANVQTLPSHLLPLQATRNAEERSIRGTIAPSGIGNGGSGS